MFGIMDKGQATHSKSLLTIEPEKSKKKKKSANTSNRKTISFDFVGLSTIFCHKIVGPIECPMVFKSTTLQCQYNTLSLSRPVSIIRSYILKNLQLKAAGLLKNVWDFSGHKVFSKMIQCFIFVFADIVRDSTCLFHQIPLSYISTQSLWTLTLQWFW